MNFYKKVIDDYYSLSETKDGSVIGWLEGALLDS